MNLRNYASQYAAAETEEEKEKIWQASLTEMNKFLEGSDEKSLKEKIEKFSNFKKYDA